MNGNYLYASYSDSSTIGTFAVQQGCSLTFLSDISVKGTRTGIINGMALHGNMLVASYTDGTIESFDISGGTPRLQRRQTIFFCHRDGAGRHLRELHRRYWRRPLLRFSAIHPPILSVEVSDISSGKLTKTTVFKSPVSISSSTIMLRPGRNHALRGQHSGSNGVGALLRQGDRNNHARLHVAEDLGAVAKLVIPGWAQSYQSNRKWRRSLRC